MEITKLHIKNYRSIKDSQEIELTKLFGLIGKNNTGKSAILKAVQILCHVLDVQPMDFHKNEEVIEISSVFKDEKYKTQENSEGVAKIKVKITKDSRKEYFLNDAESDEKTIKKLLPELLVINDIRDPN